LALVIWN